MTPPPHPLPNTPRYPLELNAVYRDEERDYVTQYLIQLHYTKKRENENWTWPENTD